MNNKTVLGIVVVVIVVITGFFVFYSNRSYSPSTSTQNNPQGTQTPATPVTKQSSPPTQPTQEENTITYTSNGFLPSTLTIKVGTDVAWVNKSSEQVKVGVNPHPIHTGDRVITNGEFTLDLAPGESKTVTVNKTGTFGYHNHLNPSQTGTISVQ